LLAGTSQDGKHQRVHAIRKHDSLLELGPGKGHSPSLAGRLFFRRELLSPPRTTSEFEAALTERQLSRFRADTAGWLAGSDPRIEFAVLAWHRGGLADVLILRIDAPDGELRLSSLDPAPNDRNSLLLRAGPDAAHLASKKVVVFGVGAVGSQVALGLSECGVGKLHLVDGDRLRPGNVVRHVGRSSGVGFHKATIIAVEIEEHAPWCKVTCSTASSDSPKVIRDAIQGFDLVLDLTGRLPFKQLVAHIASDMHVPLVSACLYRGGAVGRIRRQAPGDRPISERTNSTGYLVVPADDLTTEYALETGCSSPVSNAPPSSVTTLAGSVTLVAIDALTERLEYPEELVDVYKPLAVPPFERVGCLKWQSS
nr:ThiF family adenylyltransferase [Actinomycetota bacterium]